MTDEAAQAVDLAMRPCPFCGGEAKRTRWGMRDGQATAAYREHVRCKVCDASTPVLREPGKAVSAWNRRKR